MARRYDFNYEAFPAGPGHCRYTEEELRDIRARELDDYESRVPMTPAEKRALRKWVASGHSAAESPGSKYICDIEWISWMYTVRTTKSRQRFAG